MKNEEANNWEEMKNKQNEIVDSRETAATLRGEDKIYRRMPEYDTRQVASLSCRARGNMTCVTPLCTLYVQHIYVSGIGTRKKSHEMRFRHSRGRFNNQQNPEAGRGKKIVNCCQQYRREYVNAKFSYLGGNLGRERISDVKR